MQNYKEYFKGKKVTIMGLGLLGGASNDAKFLLSCGANLIITDLKTEKELESSIKKLKSFKMKTGSYVLHLGGHKLEDFKNIDFIIQPGNVPVDSPYLLEAQRNNIPVYESESLFLEQAKDITLIGVTGTRGKTTTASLIYEILKSTFGQKVHLGGNIQGTSALSLLKKIKPKDLVVMELDSWCLHGFGLIKKSPQISVFTNIMPDHLNFYLKGSHNQAEALEKYFTDKANIYKYQDVNDSVICGKEVADKIGKTNGSKFILDKNMVPKSWKLKVQGEHNLANVAYAVKVAEILKVPLSKIKKAVESFSGVAGRQELIREYKGIKIYNNTTATTPEATVAALKSFGIKGKKNIVLIIGGSDKGISLAELSQEIPKYCRAVILLPGTGSAKLNLSEVIKCDNLKQAVDEAVDKCQKGDTLLFSPSFASFGMFKNEYDRGEQFNKVIKSLK